MQESVETAAETFWKRLFYHPVWCFIWCFQKMLHLSDDGKQPPCYWVFIFYVFTEGQLKWTVNTKTCVLLYVFKVKVQEPIHQKTTSQKMSKYQLSDLGAECPPWDWKVDSSNPRLSHTKSSTNGMFDMQRSPWSFIQWQEFIRNSTLKWVGLLAQIESALISQYPFVYTLSR